MKNVLLLKQEGRAFVLKDLEVEEAHLQQLAQVAAGEGFQVMYEFSDKIDMRLIDKTLKACLSIAELADVDKVWDLRGLGGGGR